MHTQREFRIVKVEKKKKKKKVIFANPYSTAVNILVFLFQFIYYI